MNHLSIEAQLLKAEWLKEDKNFFSKYRNDQRAMQVVNALAELVANYNRSSQPIIFC